MAALARICEAPGVDGLTRLNARAFVWMLERLPADPKRAQAHFFEAAAADGPYPAAIAPHAVDAEAAFVFTLGARPPLLYLTLTAADPARIGALLVRLEAEGAGVGQGAAALRLADGYLAAHGRPGLALLPASAVPLFPGIPDAIQFDGAVLEPRSVVFLDEDELALAERLGAGALAQRFRLIGRNLLRLAATRR